MASIEIQQISSSRAASGALGMRGDVGHIVRVALERRRPSSSAKPSRWWRRSSPRGRAREWMIRCSRARAGRCDAGECPTACARNCSRLGIPIIDAPLDCCRRSQVRRRRLGCREWSESNLLRSSRHRQSSPHLHLHLHLHPSPHPRLRRSSPRRPIRSTTIASIPHRSSTTSRETARSTPGCKPERSPSNRLPPPSPSSCRSSASSDPSCCSCENARRGPRARRRRAARRAAS